MKKTFLSSAVVVFAAALLVLPGCKKDSNKSAVEFITSGTWKYTSITDNGSEDILDCEKDDTETYTSGGQYTYGEGADDCGGSQSGYVGTYAFISNNSKIIYDGSDTVNVIQLDENTFKWAYADEPTLIFTLKH